MTTCPSVDLLAQVLAGELDEPSATVLRRHVSECPVCQGRLDQLSDDAALGRFKARGEPAATPVPPEPGLERLMRQLAVQPPEITGSIGRSPQGATPDFFGPPRRPGELGSLGRYRVIEELGRGGMGVVYRAEQEEPIYRRVAVKVIKAGMDSSHVLARFEQERQTLALMDHPHIAKVFDAGTTPGGRPFFVMELVKGVPITRYCDQERLTLPERLELFVPVCQAVQHAHQKGIIHRDLKPSNVLIALHDGRPVPKVIDFGVAKVTSQKLTERTLVTVVGEVVGTLEYMAPEQAELNNLDIDTRADVYALGALLYELLTGAPPFTRQQLRSVPFTEMLRMIREVEPLKPSTRLSGSEALPRMDAQRKPEPRRLTRLVRGDLDWIVMKCLEKERGRRYETANALALDLQRHLADEPVLAGPPGASYRLRKFVRRNWGPVLAAAVLLLALVGGIAGTTAGLVEAHRQRDAAVELQGRAETAEARAKEEAAIAQAVTDFLQKDLLSQADIGNQPRLGGGRERNPNIPIGELLDRAAQKIEGKFPHQPLTEAAIRLTLGNTYRELGRYDAAQRHLERAMELRTIQLGADHPDTQFPKGDLGSVYYHQGKYDRAEPLLKEVLDARSATLGPNHPDTLLSKNNLAELYQAQGKRDVAEPLLKEVLDARSATLGADHPQTLISKNNLAVLYFYQGQFAKAEPLLKEVLDTRLATLGADHPDTLSSKNNLGGVYRAQGKYNLAEPLFKEMVETRVAKQGANHPATLTGKHNLALLYVLQGKYDLAGPLFKEVLDARLATLGAEHPQTLMSMNKVASMYQHEGKLDEAEALYREAVERARTTLGMAHANTQAFVHDLIDCYEARGQPARAEPLLRELVDLSRRQAGADSPRYAGQLVALGLNRLRQRKGSDAEAVLRTGLLLRQQKEPEAWTTFHTQALLGAALVLQEKYAEAEPLLARGYEGMKQREAEIPAGSQVRLSETLEWLVQLYNGWGKNDQADAWRKRLEERKAASPGPANLRKSSATDPLLRVPPQRMGPR